jgi:transposase
VSAQPRARLHAFAGDAASDAALAQAVPASREVVRFVGVHLVRPTAGPTCATPPQRRNGIKKRLKDRVLRTGAPWRDLPERVGPCAAAWSRFRRWTAAGVWARVLAALQRGADLSGKLDFETHYVDGTVVRADHHAAGAVGGQADEALGRSGGGFSTKGPPAGRRRGQADGGRALRR